MNVNDRPFGREELVEILVSGSNVSDFATWIDLLQPGMNSDLSHGTAFAWPGAAQQRVPSKSSRNNLSRRPS
jgi:hypothetical protein